MATPPFNPDETLPSAADLISAFPAVSQTFRDIIESWILFEHNRDGNHDRVGLDDKTAATPAGATGIHTIWAETSTIKARWQTGTVMDVLLRNPADNVVSGNIDLGGTLDVTGAATFDALLTAADKIAGSAGTAALPSVYLGGDTTTGIYRPGANEIGFTVSGVIVAKFTGATFDMSNNKIVNLGAPVSANDAARKTDVDAITVTRLHVRDEKATSTHGGDFNAGGDRTRVLNTTVSNNITGASLVTNQITLPAGTYKVYARAPGLDCGNHKAWLYNVSDAGTVIDGSSARSGASNEQVESIVMGVFTLAGAKVLELRHRCTISRATDGFGQATGLAGRNEVYAEVFIEKVA